MSENKQYEDVSSEKVTDEDNLNPEILEDQEFEELITEDPSGEIEKLKLERLKLSEENKKFSNEIEALKERLSRTSAEYDNFRKRTAKEKEGIYTDACEDILKIVLPVLDNLERAHAVEGTAEDIKKGVEMTVRQFDDALVKLQVEVVPSDVEFDPNMHNAVMHIDDEAFGKNEIVEVFQKGYKRGNKILRYSMVKVAN